MTNLRKYPKYKHKADKQQTRRTTRRELTVWELCKDCADQMYSGIRCLVHNPTPEMRAASNSTNTTETTTSLWEELKGAFEDELNDWP